MNTCKTFIIDGRCSNCGTAVEDTHKFCHECGKRLHPSWKKDEQIARAERNDEIVKMFKSGYKTKEVAEKVGLSYSRVNQMHRSWKRYKTLD